MEFLFERLQDSTAVDDTSNLSNKYDFDKNTNHENNLSNFLIPFLNVGALTKQIKGFMMQSNISV